MNATETPGNGPEQGELDDLSFGRLIALGALIGTPVTFAVVYLVMLVGTGRPGLAPAIIWTSLVAGGYFGGFVALNLGLARRQERHTRPAQAAPPASTEARRAA